MTEPTPQQNIETLKSGLKLDPKTHELGTQVLIIAKICSLIDPEFQFPSDDGWKLRVGFIFALGFNFAATSIPSRTTFLLQLEVMLEVMLNSIRFLENRDLKAFGIDESSAQSLIKDVKSALAYIKAGASRVEWLQEYLKKLSDDQTDET